MYRAPAPGYYGSRPPNPHNVQWNPRGQQWQRNHTPGFRAPMRPVNYNEEHWCETCDRGFPTMAVLEKHKQQHQKCNIDGCQFVAHPKVITKHIQMQHSSGLYKKIANLNNPEEVNKWREERKNKYPTKQNVEKKEAQIKEKIERGEKMGLKNNRNNKRTDQKYDAQTKRKNPFDNEKYENRKKFQQSNSVPREKNKMPRKKNEKTLPMLEDHRKLKPFAGIQDLVMDCYPNVEDNVQDNSYNLIDDIDDYGIEPPKLQDTPQVNEPTVCGALSSLICNYESSDEEIESNKEKISKEIGSLKQKTLENTLIEKTNQHNEICLEVALQNGNKLNNEITENNGSDEDGPEEIKLDKKVESEVVNAQEQSVKVRGQPEKNIKRNNNVGRHKRMILNKRRSKLPSTLLQKLLHREIRQERNVVLQCIRYIVKSNYFVR